MDARETLRRTDWLSVLVAALFLWTWLTIGRWLTGQPQFPSNISGVAGDGTSPSDVRFVVLHFALCVLGTLLLAWIQIRRPTTDAIGAGLVGVLYALIPIAVLAGDAYRSGTFAQYAPGYLILLTGLVGTSVVLQAVRSR